LKLVTAKAKPKAKAGGSKTKIGTKGATAKAKPTVKAKAKVVAKVKAKPLAKLKIKAKPAPKISKAKPASKPVVKAKSAANAVKKIVPKPLLKGAKPAPKYVPPKTELRISGLATEAELLRQPKSDYMSSAQRKFFKHRLLELQTQMRDNADATTEHLRELAVAPDPADRATQEEEHALELRTRDRERKLLKKIEAALLRIEDGSYGYCEETGEPIGVPRLLARPTATLTIEAQERRELKQKMYGE
jgi:DnaK suppressor protein